MIASGSKKTYNTRIHQTWMEKSPRTQKIFTIVTFPQLTRHFISWDSISLNVISAFENSSPTNIKGSHKMFI